MGKLLKKPISRLYNAPSQSGYILVMSLLSGYPVGAKLIDDFYENGTKIYALRFRFRPSLISQSLTICIWLEKLPRRQEYSKSAV